MDIPGAKWIIYPSLLIVLVLVSYYVLQLFRNMALGGTADSEDYLGSFRKMRDEGMIAPDEYKKVAGLVPMPETESNDDPAIESGAEALTEAAKEAIRKSASKNSGDSAP